MKISVFALVAAAILTAGLANSHLVSYHPVVLASSRIDVIIDDEAEDSQVEMLLKNILALENVFSAEFVHPDQALQELVEILGADDGILASLSGDLNPLRRSIRIEIISIRFAQETSEVIRQMPGVLWINIWDYSNSAMAQPANGHH